MQASEVDVSGYLHMGDDPTLWQRVTCFWIDMIFAPALVGLAAAGTMAVGAFLFLLVLWIVSWFTPISITGVLSSYLVTKIIFPIAGAAATIFWLYHMMLRHLGDQGASPGMMASRLSAFRSDNKEICFNSGIGGVGLGRAIEYYLVRIIGLFIVLGALYITMPLLGINVLDLSLIWDVAIGLSGVLVVSLVFSIPVARNKSLGDSITRCYTVSY